MKFRQILLFCLGIAVLVTATGVAWFFNAEVTPEFNQPIRASVEFYDRHGVSLRTLLVDQRTHVRPVDVSTLPEHVIHAVLAAEDKRFFEHHGVDFLATGRAIKQMLQHGRFCSGASTISQQLVKMLSPGKRTFIRKLEEIRVALALERTWSKEQILQEYVNRLEYGDLQQGIESASRYYFGKPAATMSIAESAFLAGLPNAPSRLNPYLNQEGAQQRQQYVLRRMMANGVISSAQYTLASEEPLILQVRGNAFRAPHFVDFLLTRTNLIPEAGGDISTTLDLELNAFATQLLESQLASLADKNVGSAAIVVLHNPTGEVLAMAASGHSVDATSNQVNTAWLPRSAGSAIKPFTYILAMEAGAFPGTIVPDVATSFATPTGIYRPNNYNRRFYGPVSLRNALGNSLNIAAIRALEIGGGPDKLLRLLREMDITTLGHPSEHYGLGLTLGNGETRLAELANAYGTIARQGIHRPIRLLQHGRSSQDPGRRVFSATSAWLVADILSDNTARASSFGLDSFLALPFPAACKTGTSSSYRDNVSVGFTPEFTVAVWVGNADGSPMRQITGVTGAAPVMHEMLCHLHDQFGTTWFNEPPDGIHEVWIHPLLGKQIPADTQGAVLEKCATLPVFAEPNDYDTNGKIRLSSEYADWLLSSQNALGNLVSREIKEGNLAIVSPDPGTVYFLDPDLPMRQQRAVFRVNGHRNVQWHCETLISAEGDAAGFLLQPGIHQITVEDLANAQTASTWIEVREL